MKRIFYAFFTGLLSAVVFLTGCSGPSSNYQQRVINIYQRHTANALSLYTDSEISMTDELCGVGINFTPADSQVKIWTDTDVVSLDDAPEQIEDTWVIRFTPRKTGSFTIYAESGSRKKSQTINISPVINSIQITGNSNPLDPGLTTTLTATITPASSSASVVWASSDTSVATVNSSGVVTAVGPGTATITATVKNPSKDPLYEVGSVSDAFDITVNGFSLNDNFFVLCHKDTNDQIEAKVIQIDVDDVTWSSSNENLFTVTRNSSDHTKATLTYVDGASGTGTVTATLTNSSGTQTRQATVVVANYFMLALGDSIAAGYAPEPLGPEDTDLKEQDMINAYKQYMNRRKGGSTNPNYVNEFCYSSLLKQHLSATRNISLYSYARTGDQTQHLLAKLASTYRDGELATKQGEILEAVNQADYITLCIGANDILQRATGANILMRNEQWFRTTFDQDLATFKTTFDSILNILAGDGRTVYVMSVYSPYHHFTTTNIPSSQQSMPYKTMTDKIIALNNIAEEYLDQLNAYIQSKAATNNNVVFVDVASVINACPVSEHAGYIHSDPRRLNLQLLVSKFGSVVPIWFDPHPTKLGAAKIKDVYASAMQN